MSVEYRSVGGLGRKWGGKRLNYRGLGDNILYPTALDSSIPGFHSAIWKYSKGKPDRFYLFIWFLMLDSYIFICMYNIFLFFFSPSRPDFSRINIFFILERRTLFIQLQTVSVRNFKSLLSSAIVTYTQKRLLHVFIFHFSSLRLDLLLL